MSELKDRVAALIEQHPDGGAPIVLVGDPVLRQPSERYDGQLDELLQPFLQLLSRTMKASKGVGVAAPQIGIPLSMVVLGDTAELAPDVTQARGRRPFEEFYMINPSYKQVPRKGGGLKPRKAVFYEGCLSVPGIVMATPRWLDIEADYLDPTGEAQRLEASDWLARVIQHETDHPNGKLYVDIAKPRSMATMDSFLSNWNTPRPDRAAKAFGFRL